jgi:hypothetical protein
VLEARLAGADAALARLVGPALGTDAMAEAAEIAEAAVRAADGAGRPLFAANAGSAVPAAAHLRLWWAATCLREHRGDGHVAALLHAGLDGCEAHLVHIAAGAATRAVLQENRGWTDPAWADAAARLRRRGLLDGAGRLTGAGAALHRALEDDTDRLAAGPFEAIGAERSDRLAALVGPLATAIVASGVIPMPNPIGLPAPAGDP